MSNDTALSPQPNAQPAPPPNAGAADPGSVTPPAGGAPNGQPNGGAPAGDAPRGGMGDNGGPDWRAMLAGEDAKALERLSRFPKPDDVWKSYREMETKLSQRPMAVDITENSTPEQIADYRKSNDIHDLGADAKDAAYAEAYGIKAPDGYEMDEAEQAMLGRFAKSMNAAHTPKKFVQKAVAEHFAITAAMKEQVSKVAKVKGTEWHNKLRDELGSREYEARQGAAKQWLESQFQDTPDEMANILLAQLPGGGYLGDHPFFFNLFAEKAMGAGFTDRIEANSMESTGKSLAAQQQEIEGLMFKDPAKYNLPGTQTKLNKILELRLSRGEIDDSGEPVRKRRSA
jgi:hypothetical protein